MVAILEDGHHGQAAVPSAFGIQDYDDVRDPPLMHMFFTVCKCGSFTS
jgi:hypothetical protein